MLIRGRHSNSTFICLLFLTYVGVLQILYEFQSVVVSVPFVALVSTLYFLIFQRLLSKQRQQSRTSIPSTGSNKKSTSTTHEKDLQSLLVQQTETILKTNLQHFHQVNEKRFLRY